MKTEQKKQEKCQVELTVSLEASEMKTIYTSVERSFMRQASLPGFRPGKVPLALIRKQFANQMQVAVQREMVQNFLPNAAKEEKLTDAAVVDVKDVKASAEEGSFVAVLEVKPEIPCPEYKGLKLKSEDFVVQDGDITAQIERMRKSCAKFEDAKEGETISEGDFVQIDYAGTVGSKPIIEVAPEAKVVAQGTGFWTQLEEGRFLPEILDALKGMKLGETKEKIKATFDKEAAPEPLKGKKAVYTVTVKAFRRRLMPTDAEFLEKMKAESLEKLTADVRESMLKEAERQNKARRENEAIDLLLKDAKFDVPPSQVRRATDNFLRQYAETAQRSGVSAEYFEQNRDKILKDAEENAERQVRLWYLIEAIAKAEKIEADDATRGQKVLEVIMANIKK